LYLILYLKPLVKVELVGNRNTITNSNSNTNNNINHSDVNMFTKSNSNGLIFKIQFY